MYITEMHREIHALLFLIYIFISVDPLLIEIDLARFHFVHFKKGGVVCFGVSHNRASCFLFNCSELQCVVALVIVESGVNPC
jgi:hypothetical protein